MTVKISMWSGPRNISTAMMYSFRQRPDTQVVDEPLYGAYLTRVPDVGHPDVASVVASMDCDFNSVVSDMRADSEIPVRFFKNMAHHLEGVGFDALDGLKNFILCRPPAEQIVSLDKGMTIRPVLRDTGYAHQVGILDRLLELGEEPVVVVAPEILANPEGMMRALCAELGLRWEAAMLAWPSGPKAEDGVWASHWYERVHATTGFAPPRTSPVGVPGRLDDLYEECLPYYERLHEHALRPLETS